MSARKTKRQVICSSDEEDCIKSPDGSTVQRVSTRLKKRCGKGRFVMPSRDKIWDSIPSDHSIKPISPKKTVNNFTKVYNSYNYDDYEDTSDDDDHFIEDSDEQSSDEESSSENEGQKKGRVKNFRKRIKLSASSDEDSEESKNIKHAQPQPDDEYFVSVGKKSNSEEVTDFSQINGSPNSDANASSEEDVSPVKRRRNASVLESSDENASNVSDDSETDPHEVKVENAHSRSSSLKQKKDELFQKFKDVQKQRRASNKM